MNPGDLDHPPSIPARPRRITLILVAILLFLAAIHCAASIFFVNYSYLDLKAYASGAEKMPYQGRIGMMPILELAERSPRFTALAARIDTELRGKHKHSRFEEITPESLACMIAGTLSLLASVLIAAIYGLKRYLALWWMPPALLLAMLYITQCARYETALWYPYDLPHALLFGSACLLLLEGLWLPALAVFLIDLPVRETAIFLAAIGLAVAWARNRRGHGIAVAALMLAAWIPFRIYIRHRFAANPTELGFHFIGQFHAALNPVNWPQIASAFGFLLVPICLGNRLLARPQRAFMLGALPCLIATLAFGVWSETRIFGEWLLPAAVLLTAEASELIARRDLLATLPADQRGHPESL